VRALISTTINVPGNLTKWREALDDDDVVIIAGDLQSPHDEITAYMADLPGKNVYLHPDEQTHWTVSAHIGWRCIQRRNIATLEALRYKPEYIISVDDDNYPTSPLQVIQYDEILRGHRQSPMVMSGSGWFNPGLACMPSVTHRGYPLHQRRVDAKQVDYNLTHFHEPAPIGVAASLWIGDPDIDAIERLATDPEVESISFPRFTLAPGTWAPFNSQATAIIGELAPLFFMWPGVGRYDDIWASYLMRAVMQRHGYLVHYGEPLVRQVRNAHDVLKDLEHEMFGMRYNGSVINALRHAAQNMPHNDNDVLANLRIAFDYVGRLDFMPRGLPAAFDAWCEDLEGIRRELTH
jgi:hypothetical protein